MFKQDIDNIKQVNNKITFIYHGNCLAAAKLRNYIKNNIYSYLIDKVTIYENKSHATNEFLASRRFGLLVLNNLNVNDDSVGNLYVVGPKMVMSSDIVGLSFVYDTPIIYLRDKEVIKCKLNISYDCGETHQKWNCTSGTTFSEISPETFQFSFELTGVLSIDQIIDQIP